MIAPTPPPTAGWAGDDDKSSFDGPHDWVTAASLIERGFASRLVLRLPVRHIGHDGQPCWPSPEVDELLALAAWEDR